MELNLLMFHQIKLYQTAVVVYKYAHALLPSRFDNYFTTGTEIHSHYTRASKSYCSIQAKSTAKRFSAKYNSPNIWNLIPANIQVAPNTFFS